MVDAKCRSWRCEGECRRHNGKVTWARVVEALEPHSDCSILFGVLTIDQNSRYSQRVWTDSTEAYRELSRMMTNYLKRLNRMLEAAGVEGIASRWVAVVEQHRSGWPHVNLVIVCPSLASIVKAQQAELDGHSGTYTDHERALLRGELLEHAEAVGWGRVSTLEVARSRGAVAGYIVKICGMHDEAGTKATREATHEGKGQLGGEVVKLSQIPMAAPKGFRRLRSGVRFLPPRRTSTYSGAMVDRGTPLKLPREIGLRREKRLAEQLAELAKTNPLAAAQAREHRELYEKGLSRLAEVVEAMGVVGLDTFPHQGAIERLRLLDRFDNHARGSPSGVVVAARERDPAAELARRAELAELAAMRARAVELGLRPLQ